MNDEVLFKIAADLSDLEPQFEDLSNYWKKHNEDIAKGQKAMSDYAKNTEKDYKKVNKVIKDKITQVASEGKALETLEKKLKSLDKSNQQAFNDNDLKKFNDTLKRVSKDLGNIKDLNIDLNDLDELSSKLSQTEDDFESLNILIDFFEKKMKSASSDVSGSFGDIQTKIKETQLNIKSTEDYIKDIGNQIDDTAPGKAQAGLIQEREAAKRALTEEKVALEDYKNQLKSVAKTNNTLETEFRHLRDEMALLASEGKRGSKRYQELSEEAEKYGRAIKETNDEIKLATSYSSGLDNVIGAVNGLVGLYSAAQGAQALLGEENEEWQQALIKLNGSLAVLNGLQAVQVELSKKGTISNRALTFVQNQYAIATDSSAKAHLRLAAATKLLGIGLLIGGIALLATHWKDIAKAMGFVSEESLRMNEVNKEANELYGKQIAELSILTKRIKEGGLSFGDKAKAVKRYNEELGDTFGTVKTYQELEKKIIEQGDEYIKYLGLKARAEAAYQLSVEKTKEALEKRTTNEVGFQDYLKTFVAAGTPGGGAYTPEINAFTRNNKNAQELEGESEQLLNIYESLLPELEKMAKQLGLSLTGPKDNLKDDTQAITKLLENLVKREKELTTELLSNNKEREKQTLIDQYEQEKAVYEKQINQLKVSEEKKKALRDKFNEIYLDDTGLAYQELQQNLLAIDEKYAAELEKVQYKALSAIDAILKGDEANSRKAIQDKWDDIRDEIQKQIDQTNDKFKKEGLEAVLIEIDTAENKELKDFDLQSDLDRVEREREISESILSIYQQNSKDIIENEELKQLQLLKNEKNYLKNLLSAYENSLDNIQDKGLFNELVDGLINSTDPAVIESIGQKLREMFGDETANEILKTVAALKEVNTQVDKTEAKIKTGFSKVLSEFAEWTSSLEGFGKKLGEALGLQGEAAVEFGNYIANAINTTVNALQETFQAEIDTHREKINQLNETINEVEAELQREQDLYTQGYANNYELRKQELEDLKQQKKKEQEELRKAQKQKAKIAKAEMAVQLLQQVSNLITSTTKITEAHSGIPFVGMLLAAGFIASMFAMIAKAKAQAKSFQSFRTGLRKGPLELSGPSHEKGGFGVYDSSNGNKVAEFENDEDIYVVNRMQRQKYKHVLDALIADAQGRASIDSTLEGYYGKTTLGNQTHQVVKHINKITIQNQTSKVDKINKDNITYEEIKKFRDDFNRELSGFSKDRADNITAWETPNFYFVRKGQKISKYPKPKVDEV